MQERVWGGKKREVRQPRDSSCDGQKTRNRIKIGRISGMKCLRVERDKPRDPRLSMLAQTRAYRLIRSSNWRRAPLLCFDLISFNCGSRKMVIYPYLGAMLSFPVLTYSRLWVPFTLFLVGSPPSLLASPRLGVLTFPSILLLSLLSCLSSFLLTFAAWKLAVLRFNRSRSDVAQPFLNYIWGFSDFHSFPSHILFKRACAPYTPLRD